MQQILRGFQHLDQVLSEAGCQRYMLVCDAAFPHLPIKDGFRPEVVFDQFSSNPLYEDVCRGVELFNAHRCDGIVAVGGGSTIDVAKCIKLYCRMDHSRNYLEQTPVDSGIPLVAIPTTAGTGSESTRYAVIYFDGKKQSVTHESIVPTCAILEPSLLQSLPLYQKKCTMLDALCQGIESIWSVNSTDESMTYGKIAIEMIVDQWEHYIFEGIAEAAERVMLAANFAGRAINITQTTAPHAMSYKLTSLFGLPHGHAVALCMPGVWSYMLEHPDACADPRGSDHLRFVLQWIGQMMDCPDPEQGPSMMRAMLIALDMQRPTTHDRAHDLDVLTHSVNPIRLKNNPVPLPEEVIYHIYDRILN